LKKSSYDLIDLYFKTTLYAIFLKSSNKLTLPGVKILLFAFIESEKSSWMKSDNMRIFCILLHIVLDSFYLVGFSSIHQHMLYLLLIFQLVTSEYAANFNGFIFAASVFIQGLLKLYEDDMTII
jgi:hypothetical protein